MTRAEKLTLVFGVTVLAIASAALLWTGSQAGRTPEVIERIVEVPVPTPGRVEAAPPQPPPPVAPPVTERAPAAEAPEAPAPREEAPQVEAEPPDLREQRNEAVRLLQTVESQLATGNIDGVDAILQTTGEALDEPARGMLAAAREALANNDLTLTRENVRRAIAAAVR